MSDLTWWLGAHPAREPGENWDEEVSDVRYETDDVVALIDRECPVQRVRGQRERLRHRPDR